MWNAQLIQRLARAVGPYEIFRVHVLHGNASLSNYEREFSHSIVHVCIAMQNTITHISKAHSRPSCKQESTCKLAAEVQVYGR